MHYNVLHEEDEAKDSMPQAPATTVRIDSALKNDANAVFNELGISLSAGITAFLKAVVREQGMPFEMRLSDREADSRIGLSTDTETLYRHIGGNANLNRAGLAKRDEVFYSALRYRG